MEEWDLRDGTLRIVAGERLGLGPIQSARPCQNESAGAAGSRAYKPGRRKGIWQDIFDFKNSGVSNSRGAEIFPDPSEHLGAVARLEDVVHWFLCLINWPNRSAKLFRSRLTFRHIALANRSLKTISTTRRPS